MRSMGLGLVGIFALGLISLAAPQPAGPTITIQVTDQATGDPIPQATVSAANEHTTTDDYGQATLAVTERGRYFSIDVSKEGYVSMGADWRNLKAGDKLPDQLTFAMAPGTSMGGKVVDENGKPVADATVELIAPGQQLREGQPHAQFRGHTHTHADGTWSINTAPAEVEMVDYMIQAPGFYNDQAYRQGPTVAEFRNRSAVLKVEHAASISGRVVDSNGKPVEGADVLAGDQGWGGVRHRARTDANGQFTLTNMRPGEIAFAVVSDQFAPQLVQVNLPTTQPAEVRLGPGNMLKIHVADSSGKPLMGVDITFDQWRNANYVEHDMRTNIHGDATWAGAPADEMMMSFSKRRFGAISDRSITATTQPIQIMLGPKTHVTGTVVDAKTGQPIKDFTVTPGLIWRNSDQIYWTNEQWAGNVSNIRDGQFEYAPTQPYPHFALRVQAAGYFPSDSEAFEDDAGDLHLTFKLNKGVEVTGVVYDSAHKPISHATVYMGLVGRPLQIGSHGVVIDNFAQQVTPVTTDAQGRFNFSPQSDAFDLLCAMPDGGYAELDAPALNMVKSTSPMPHVMVESAEPTTRPSSYDLTLQPWGSVKGKFMIGSKPGAHVELGLNMMQTRPWTGREPVVALDYHLTTDSQGQFAFDCVPPGKVLIAKIIRTANSQFFSATVTADVKPGETKVVNMGGTGRAVIGKFAVPPNFPRNSWIAWNASLRPHFTPPKGPPMPDMPLAIRKGSAEAKLKWVEQWMKTPEGKAAILAAQKKLVENIGPAMPLSIRMGSTEAKLKWAQQWIKTPEGKAFLAKQTKQMQHAGQMNFSFVVQPDGTFRIDDVPAGSYEIFTQFFPSDIMNNGGDWNHPLGVSRKEILVPAMPGGRSDEPLDVGKIPVVQSGMQ